MEFSFKLCCNTFKSIHTQLYLTKGPAGIYLKESHMCVCEYANLVNSCWCENMQSAICALICCCNNFCGCCCHWSADFFTHFWIFQLQKAKIISFAIFYVVVVGTLVEVLNGCGIYICEFVLYLHEYIFCNTYILGVNELNCFGRVFVERSVL